MSIFICGLDIAQLKDYSALVVIEAKGTPRAVTWVGADRDVGLPSDQSRYVEMMPLAQVDVRYVEIFPQLTKYKDLHLMLHQRLRNIPPPRYFVIDQTGVGNGVIEILDDLSPIGITYVPSGDPVMVAPNRYRVAKRDLIGIPRVLFQNQVLRIGEDVDNAEDLVKQLLAFTGKISDRGHDSYEALRESDHDDLVNALAIACWTATQIISVNALNVLRQIEGDTWREPPPSISPY